MKTRIEKIGKENWNNDIMTEAGAILKQGGLVAFPTETVYGLGADALNEAAAAKTYEAKGRPSDNPLIVHIARIEDLRVITEQVPALTYKIADRFWPGPLTMILKKSDAVPYGTTGGLDTVAVRMPDHAAARALILAGGGFVSAPSANTSGRPSPTEAAHVEEDLTGKIDMILDGGMVEIGLESTILDMTVSPPMILRPGAITREMLMELVGTIDTDKAILHADSEEAPKAPGMKYRHYAPKAKLTVVEGSIEAVVEEINRLTAASLAKGCRIGIIGTEETIGRYCAGEVKNIGTRKNENTIAASLYGILREFDELGVDYIYSEAFAEDGIGSAVMNRLMKAAGHHVIRV